MKIIGHIETDFETKFGLPRQSGLCDELKGKIVFKPEYSMREAFRGLDGFSHIWVIWNFSLTERDGFSPTVRPPRLGGKKRVGVFATRSPYRPNPIGLSCVKLEKTDYEKGKGTVLYVSGIDMANGTPIYDIKPYLPIADLKPDATEGFTGQTALHRLNVFFSPCLPPISDEMKKAITEFIENDPRPAYDKDENRIYGSSFKGFDIRFTVKENEATVTEIIPLNR